MVVGDNKLMATKNAGKFLAILIVRHGAHRLIEHVQGFTGSHWMPPLGECLRRIAPAASIVNEFVEKRQTLTKHNF